MDAMNIGDNAEKVSNSLGDHWRNLKFLLNALIYESAIYINMFQINK